MPSLRCVSHQMLYEALITYTSHTGSGHQSPGLWRHPDDQSSRFGDVDHWVELAKLLEDAKFHGIFIADVLGEIASSPRSLTPDLY
jgi:alkanesulfonate monooxygenase SsuD/methylene tetrahydromethanopterin reductase-like flavin-dependent oxidoreductase (luciferase family)